MEEGEWDVVTISTEGTSQVVIADAIRLLTVGKKSSPPVIAEKPNEEKAPKENLEEKKRLQALVADLKKQIAVHKKKNPASAGKVMSVNEGKDPGDWRIHNRGAIRNLGPYVKRGFLAVATPKDQSSKPDIPKGASGRLELADWVTSPKNPLTARVYANRVWRHRWPPEIPCRFCRHGL